MSCSQADWDDYVRVYGHPPPWAERRRPRRIIEDDPEDLYERGRATLRWGGEERPYYQTSHGATPVNWRRS